MRHVADIDAWITERRRSNTALIAELAEAPRVARRRPRVEGEDAVLERATLDAIARRIAEGRLVRLGSRHWELRER